MKNDNTSHLPCGHLLNRSFGRKFRRNFKVSHRDLIEKALAPYEGLVVDKRLVNRMVEVVMDAVHSCVTASPPADTVCKRCNELQELLNASYTRCSQAVLAERDALLKLKAVHTKSTTTPPSVSTPSETKSVIIPESQASQSNFESLDAVEIGILLWLHNKLQNGTGTKSNWNSWVDSPTSLTSLTDELFVATEIPATILYRISPHVSTDSIGRLTPASWRRLGKILQTFSDSLTSDERRGLLAMAQSAVNSRASLF